MVSVLLWQKDFLLSIISYNIERLLSIQMGITLTLQDLKGCLRRLTHLKEIIEALEVSLIKEQKTDKIRADCNRAAKEVEQIRKILGDENDELDVSSALRSVKEREAAGRIIEEINAVGTDVIRGYEALTRLAEEGREDTKEKLKIIRKAREMFDHFLRMADEKEPKFFDVKG